MFIRILIALIVVLLIIEVALNIHFQTKCEKDGGKWEASINSGYNNRNIDCIKG